MLAADFELLVDAADFAARFSSDPTELTKVGEIVFFVASTPTTGSELWKTDGTAAGTILVKDIRSGESSSGPVALTNIDGTLYFSATDGLRGRDVWKSDGTATGTIRVTDIPYQSPTITEIVAAGDSIYFTTFSTVAPQFNGLCKSNGAPSGTSPVRPAESPNTALMAQNLTEMNGLLYFFAHDATHGRELWRSDGTPEGTYVFRDLVEGAANGIPASTNPLDPVDLVNIGGMLYFPAATGPAGKSELWTSDGTPEGTTRLRAATSQYSFAPRDFFEFEGSVYFTAREGASGTELWKSDGTVEGTTLVKDIWPGTGAAFTTLRSGPQFATHNGQLYFVASSSSQSRSIWRTDGTAAGTVSVVSLPPSSSMSFDYHLTSMLGKLYFVTPENDVYASDGTNPGTVQLQAFINPTTSWPTPRAGSFFVDAGGKGVFPGDTAELRRQLWVSNGSPHDTHLLAEINGGTGDSYSLTPVEFQGSFYFVARSRLWRSNGSASGTTDVTLELFGAPYGIGGIRHSATDAFYLTAKIGDAGEELWKSDGTAAGTLMVKDINPGPGDSTLSSFSVDGDTLYFSANDGVNGSRLWRSDGTPQGTLLVEQANGEPIAGYGVLGVDGGAIFSVTGDSGRRELWRLDGNVATKLTDVYTSGSGVRLDGKVYFNAYRNAATEASAELWVTDGTAEGTALVRKIRAPGRGGPWELTVHQGLLYFIATDEDFGVALWRSDGTTEGTMRVAGIQATGYSHLVKQMISVDGLLYFAVDDGANGFELWRSDGTADGTRRLTNSDGNPAFSLPNMLTNVYGTLYFTAYDEVHGEELWKSDGTPEGTGLVNDFAPGAAGSAIRWIRAYRGGVTVAASTPAYGSEVWSHIPDSQGDYTGDGVTDGDDFLAWQRGYGSAAAPAGSGADGNENGAVDAADLAIWKANYGTAPQNAVVTASENVVANDTFAISRLLTDEPTLAALATPEASRDLDFNFDAAFAAFGAADTAALAGISTGQFSASTVKFKDGGSARNLHREARAARLAQPLPSSAAPSNDLNLRLRRDPMLSSNRVDSLQREEDCDARANASEALLAESCEAR